MPNKKILFLLLLALVGFWIAPRVREGYRRRMGPAPEPHRQTQSGTGYDEGVTLTLLDRGRVVRLTLREYLCGVLCAELPADFPEEVWKAQAVAARSYALYKTEHPTENHPGAALCTDYTCCTGFRWEEELRPVWNSGGQTLRNLAEGAAAATDGVVAVYEGAVIGAVWHSASAPYTASAAQVWGGEVAYLQQAESPGGEDSPSYHGVTRIPAEQLRRILLEGLPGAMPGPDPETWITDLTRSRGGYVVTARAGGVPVRGSTLRALLELPSAAFTVERAGSDLIFTTVGTGHGVGMSQYGAARLARTGSRWDQILTHYYKDIKLLKKTE